MKQYDKEKPIISLHIPKCGGSSLNVVLQRWFKRKLYRHYFNERKNQMPKRHNLKSIIFRQRFKTGICIHGHFNNERNFGVFDYYPEVDQFFAFLREPFEIRVSLYFYAKRQELKAWSKFKDINDYLLRGGIANPYLLNYMPYEVTMTNYREIIEKHFVYLGVIENMQTSVNVLAEKLGFFTTKVKHLNVAKRDEDISADLREEFKRTHPLEYAVYEYALNTYNKV